MTIRLYRFLVLGASAALVQSGHAQPNLINRSAVRQDSGFIFVAEENRVEITGVNNGTWQLKAQHADIIKTDNPWLFIVVENGPGTDTLKLIRSGKIVLTKVFYSRYLPDAKARLGSITDSFASKAQIIANRVIVVVVAGCATCGPFKVIDYQIDFVTNVLPDWKKQVKIQGAALTEDAIGSIRQLATGDKLVFSEVRAAGRSNRIRVLPPFTLTVK